MLNNIAQYPTRQSFNSAIDKVDKMDKIMPVVRTEFSRASEDTYILYG